MRKMGRKTWSKTEDLMLCFYIEMHGADNWDEMARILDIQRSGSSCRHRWNNELKLGVRLGDFTDQETLRILELHLNWGNSWTRIAKQFPGRTDNEVKNLWNSQLTRKAVELGHMVGSHEFLQFMRARVQRGGGATTAVGPSSTISAAGGGAASGDIEARLREIEAHLMRDEDY